jgi:hypothetical protein
VALQKSFRDLCTRLQELQEVLEAVNTTVEEDRPRRKDVVVASSLGDAVLAVRGVLEESCAAADEAYEAAGQLDMDHVRRALTTCQERFHHFEAEFSHDLASYERMADLASVAQERGRDWASWVKVVKQGLEQCQALVEAGRDALFLCWQDLTERLGTASVQVRNTSIGQLAKDFDRRGGMKG